MSLELLQFCLEVDKRQCERFPTLGNSAARVSLETKGMAPVSGPVERLVKLLQDETRIDEKIRDAKTAVSLVRKRVSETLAQHYIATRETRIQVPEDLMKEEQS